MMECDRGCGASFLKSKLNEHECDFQKCLFSDYGCKYRAKISDMEKHLKDEVVTHLSLTMRVVTWYIIGS